MLPPKRTDPAVEAEAENIVRASRAFCDCGGFAAQADSLATEVRRALTNGGGTVSGGQVLAAGCGEGFYLRRVAECLEEAAAREVAAGADKAAAAAGDAADERFGLWGTDTNKLAVRYAAKRQPAARFAVASSHRLPFADGSFDIVFSCFSPAPWEEFCRVLRPGGAVIVARGGRDHLQELRALAGAEPRRPPKESHISQGFGENYLRVRTVDTFAGEAAQHLLAMTPCVHAASPEREQKLQRLAGTGLETTVDFIITTHRVWLGTANCKYEL